MEVWKDIEGYKGLYQISSYGKVMNQSKKILSQSKQTNGYFIVSLYKDGSYKFPLVHRLIAIHFIPNPKRKSDVNHKNGIKTDNSIENLEWATRAENMAHATKTGLMKCGMDCSHSKLTDADVLFIHFNKHLFSPKEISEILLIKQWAVYQVRCGTSWNKLTRIKKLYKADRLQKII